MTAHQIATKFRRALRNGTSATFTFDQLREFASYGFLEQISKLEADELCSAANRHLSEIPPPAAEQNARPVSAADKPRKMTPEEGRRFVAELSRDL